jgi:class 3 adenylate cyclase
MESTGIPGRVHVSADTHALLRHLGDEFDWECRGDVAVKGVGTMVTYLLRQEH